MKYIKKKLIPLIIVFFRFFPNRPVKSNLLDILLLRASGWKVEDNMDEQEIGSLSTEDEVLLEAEDDVTAEQPREEIGDQDDSEGELTSTKEHFPCLSFVWCLLDVFV